MKIIVVLAVVAVCAAFPQKEGGAYTNEAIKQAQNTFLIPKDAQIQKVSIGRVGSGGLRRFCRSRRGSR
jgi:hypothetical protein